MRTLTNMHHMKVNGHMANVSNEKKTYLKTDIIIIINMWNNYLNKIRHTDRRRIPMHTRTRTADAASAAAATITTTTAAAAPLKHHIRIKYNRKNYLHLFVSAVVCYCAQHTAFKIKYETFSLDSKLRSKLQNECCDFQRFSVAFWFEL